MPFFFGAGLPIGPDSFSLACPAPFPYLSTVYFGYERGDERESAAKLSAVARRCGSNLDSFGCPRVAESDLRSLSSPKALPRFRAGRDR